MMWPRATARSSSGARRPRAWGDRATRFPTGLVRGRLDLLDRRRREAPSPEAFRESLSAIRSIPTWSIGLVALGVPLAELTAAGLLLVSPRVGAAIALGLLVSFSVVAERLHRLGQKVHCACFGNLGGDRLGRGTVV